MRTVCRVNTGLVGLSRLPSALSAPLPTRFQDVKQDGKLGQGRTTAVGRGGFASGNGAPAALTWRREEGGEEEDDDDEVEFIIYPRSVG